MSATTARRVLVTGANGRTGRAVVQALARAAIPVRAFVRNAAQAPALEALGAAEHAVGDMLEPATIERALEGCDALVHIGPPMHAREKEMTGHFIAAAQRAGLPHFVYYSVMHPLRTEVRHHRLKLETEERLVESDLPYTILQPMRYMQHLEQIWKRVVSEGVHAMPFNIEVRFNVVDLADLAAATAFVIGARERHVYATYELCGPEALSQRDMARVLTEVLGRPVEARAIAREELEAKARASGTSEDRVAQMVAMNAHYDRHGFRGNPNVLRMLLGREPTTFRAYVERLRIM